MTRVYAPSERPDIEAMVDGEWFRGELRMWTQREDGSWWAQVNYSRGAGRRFLTTLPAEHVRRAAAT